MEFAKNKSCKSCREDVQDLRALYLPAVFTQKAMLQGLPAVMIVGVYPIMGLGCSPQA